MNANDLFKDFTGTENYYRHILGMVYTDGVKALCDRFECYWLLDIVCSYQPQLKHEEFQVWSLTVNNDGSAFVLCTDGNNRLLANQGIPFTDFEAKEAIVWVEANVILLPSEH